MTKKDVKKQEKTLPLNQEQEKAAKLEEFKENFEDKMEDIQDDIEDKTEDLKDKIEFIFDILGDLPKWLKIAVFVVPSILIVLLILIISTYFNKPKEIIITESTLKEIQPASDLTTIEFIYRATATKESDLLKVDMYHVAYEGKIRASFNFNEIDYEIDEQNKIVTITIPKFSYEATINTDPNTIDLMFMNDRYETDTVGGEALELARQDLKQRLKSDKTIKTKSKENAKSLLEGFYKSWIETIDDEYKVVVK